MSSYRPFIVKLYWGGGKPTSMMDLLRGFSASQSYVGEMGSPTHVDNQLIYQQPADEEQEDGDEELEDADEELEDAQEDG
ncbi:hypothetical protein R6Q57_025904 [Mikania cordata]